MRDLDRQARGLLVTLASYFKQAEGIEALTVFHQVLTNAGQQRQAQERLIGRDGIGDGDVIGRVKSEYPRVFFADERVVVNFSEALRGHLRADAAQEFALRSFRRHAHRDRWGLRRDRVVPDHAADFLDQVVLD